MRKRMRGTPSDPREAWQSKRGGKDCHCDLRSMHDLDMPTWLSSSLAECKYCKLRGTRASNFKTQVWCCPVCWAIRRRSRALSNTEGARDLICSMISESPLVSTWNSPKSEHMRSCVHLVLSGVKVGGWVPASRFRRETPHWTMQGTEYNETFRKVSKQGPRSMHPTLTILSSGVSGDWGCSGCGTYVGYSLKNGWSCRRQILALICNQA